MSTSFLVTLLEPIEGADLWFFALQMAGFAVRLHQIYCQAVDRSHAHAWGGDGFRPSADGFRVGGSVGKCVFFCDLMRFQVMQKNAKYAKCHRQRQGVALWCIELWTLSRNADRWEHHEKILWDAGYLCAAQCLWRLGAVWWWKGMICHLIRCFLNVSLSCQYCEGLKYWWWWWSSSSSSWWWSSSSSWWWSCWCYPWFILGCHGCRCRQGETFQIKSVCDPNNLAYSNLGLQMHTDLPFNAQPPGIQLFFCMQQAPPWRY